MTGPAAAAEPRPAREPGPWPRLLEVLRCPLCGGPLNRAGGALRCPERHAFDTARQGYVSLLAGGARAPRGDTAEMVAARAEFLGAGHFAPLTRALAERAAALGAPGGCVADAGTGTGHYLARVLDALPDAVGLGLDASKFALRRAARAHPRLGAASGDLWRPLPLRDGSLGLLLNVFAPRNGPEFRRVLRPDGALLVVTPTPDHLVELRRAHALLAVDAAKEERLRRTLDAHFARAEAERHEFALSLTAREAALLVAMGPNAHHREGDDAPLPEPPATVTASFQLTAYRPR